MITSVYFTKAIVSIPYRDDKNSQARFREKLLSIVSIPYRDDKNLGSSLHLRKMIGKEFQSLIGTIKTNCEGF